MNTTIHSEIHQMCKQILKNQNTILNIIEVDDYVDGDVFNITKEQSKRIKETKKLIKEVGNRYK